MKKVILILAVIMIFVFTNTLCSQKVGEPGFRPESDLAQTFINSHKKSKFIIYPTIIRTIDTTTWSELLSREFAENLKKDKKLSVSLSKTTQDPGKLKGDGQFAIFENDMEILGKNIDQKEEKTDYNMILEIVFAPKRDENLNVFGIHVFILNNEGKNAFSFLLNSHHELFVNAKLFAKNPYEKEVEQLNLKCITVALEAFKQQVDGSN